MSLAHLLARPDIWRGRAASPDQDHTLATGWPELDGPLGGGWPVGGVIELLTDHSGIGEVSLVIPALRAMAGTGWQLWVDPPYTPHAPALQAAGLDLSRWRQVRTRSGADHVWAVEQALRAGSCAAVLAWPEALDHRALRRLQLAAEAGGALTVLYRDRAAVRNPAPAAARLELEPDRDGLRVHVRKRRGGWGGKVVGPLIPQGASACALCMAS